MKKCGNPRRKWCQIILSCFPWAQNWSRTMKGIPTVCTYPCKCTKEVKTQTTKVSVQLDRTYANEKTTAFLGDIGTQHWCGRGLAVCWRAGFAAHMLEFIYRLNTHTTKLKCLVKFGWVHRKIRMGDILPHCIIQQYLATNLLTEIKWRHTDTEECI